MFEFSFRQVFIDVNGRYQVLANFQKKLFIFKVPVQTLLRARQKLLIF